MPNADRPWWFPVLGGVLLVGVVLGVTEGAARMMPARPRAQVIDPAADDIVLSVHDGVPLWYAPGEEGLVRDADCVGPDTVDVALVSDSVLYVADPVAFPNDRLVHLLRRRLGSRGCVVDVSAPGYLPYQEFKALELAHDEVGIDVAIVVVWKPSYAYHFAAGVWWGLTGDQLVDGLPRPPLPVPTSWHEALLDRSAAWRLATHARLPDFHVRGGAEDFIGLMSWAEAQGIRLIFVQGVALDRPFSESVGDNQMFIANDWNEPLREVAEAHGHTYVSLAELLVDADVEDVRIDLCCHYNGKGHTLIDAGLGPLVEEQVDAVIAAREAPAGP